MMKNWLAQLATYYEDMRCRYPEDKLLILFDIDGTILDTRYMIHHLLHSYDHTQQTTFFQNLTIAEITVHENDITVLLETLGLDPKQMEKVLAWYEQSAWSAAAILEAHRPFGGVLEVIRWFQMQPNTFVGLNTARPESIRSETWHSLNRLGQAYKVHFPDELLYMRPEHWTDKVPLAKVAGIRHFQQAGYRVFAFIDNEPDNLQTISQMNEEILLLHADTIFQSKRAELPPQAIGGNVYDLTELIPEKALPQHIQFVWHNLNHRDNLAQFLASEVYWGEFDVRIDPTGGDLILRHDSFKQSPIQAHESWLTLDYVLDRLRYAKKGLKLDLKAGGRVIDRVLDLVVGYGFNGLNLWFNGNVEDIQEYGFQKLALAHPGAVIQCPVDFLAPLVKSTPTQTKEILDQFQNWGINRFSIDWHTPDLRTFFDHMEEWGFEINIYNVPDLNAFLQAVLLRPQSITSDFNFPKWHYYGRGLPDISRYHYSLQQMSVQNLEKHVLAYRE